MPSIVMIETISCRELKEGRQVIGEFGDGTGLIVHRDGWILTNRHLVTDAEAILLRLGDRREYWAEEVREDEWSDLALLSIRAKELPAVTFGNSDRVQVGDWVVSAGNGFGL
jgi:serine protease Do